MADHQYGWPSEWQYFKMADFQNAGLSIWRIFKMADHQHGSISKWRSFKWWIFKMADYQNGGFSKWRLPRVLLLCAVYHGIIPLPVERSSVSGDANITESWIRSAGLPSLMNLFNSSAVSWIKMLKQLSEKKKKKLFCLTNWTFHVVQIFNIEIVPQADYQLMGHSII